MIILLAAAVVGCSRYIDSRDPVRSLPDTGPVPINLTASLDNGSVTISWEVADSAGIARFRAYVADSTGAELHPVGFDYRVQYHHGGIDSKSALLL